MPIIRITDKRLVKRVDKESIVYDQDDHKVYHLNEPAAKAWELCDDCDDIQELAERLSEKTDLPADENVAQLALLELREAGLIKGEFATPGQHSMTRRELLEKLAHLAIALPVVVSMLAPTAAMAQSVPGGEPSPGPEPTPGPGGTTTPAPGSTGPGGTTTVPPTTPDPGGTTTAPPTTPDPGGTTTAPPTTPDPGATTTFPPVTTGPGGTTTAPPIPTVSPP